MHQEPRGGGLAAAGLADDADGLALGDGKGDVVDGAHGTFRGEQPAANGKVLGQAVDLKQRLRDAADVLDRLEHGDGSVGLAHGLVPDVHGAAQAVREQIEADRDRKDHRTRQSCDPGIDVDRECASVLSIRPHSGSGGFVPRPRKERPAAKIIETEIRLVA